MNTTPQDLPPVITIGEAERMLGIKRTAVYTLLGRKLLRARKIGRLLRIETASVMALIDDSPEAEIAVTARERRRAAALAERERLASGR